ncbi:MAG TPA: RNA 2',3'-cyclic phosphodiesterase [Xanthomonadaceae bacterium]|nr:RNA 2',3'-cyclic phosphodiesterase [Xanthomonadaceae bacterium]
MAPDAPALRLFAAVLPDDAARAALVRLQGELRQALGAAPLRWADPEALHLTLRFFGAVPEDRVREVEAMLAPAAAAAKSTRCELQRIEYWPPRVPRVVAAAFSCPAALAALATGLEARARALGFAPERRRFRPHVTLARGSGRIIGRAPVRLPALALDADNLALVSSLTLPEGARYRTLRRWPLG